MSDPAGEGPLLVATRSAHKLAEIRRILPGIPLESLAEAGIPPDPVEDELEGRPTFIGNAVAKARHFVERTGRRVVADDSGLRVDALGGRPGVRTKRLALDEGVETGAGVDDANNRTLLRLLRDVPGGERGAYYVCATVLAGPGGETRASLGTCRGSIAWEPSGAGGFGFDPLFLLEDGRTMAELSDAEKDARSHRGRAFRALLG
ncbi:MAG: non-canonical purine NTP pyrophosphatase [Gemmatimonadota bacterium]